MLSPKELLRDDIAKVSINYDTIINGQEESSAALSSSPGKEGWLFRRIEPEWRHDYFRDNEISNHVLRYCKVWVAMYDGRLLFSDFFSNDASVLALFNKSCASTSQVQFKNRTGSPSYIANVVGSFFNRRDSTNENESVKTTFSVSSGRSGGAGGTRCFGYLDISTGIEFKVIHKDPTEGNSEYDQFFAFEVREGDLSIEFATRTEMERQDWIEKIRECLNGKVHVLPNSSLRIPVPARARLEDASRLALLSSAGSIDKGVFPQKSGFLMKSSFNSTSSPLQSTTISFDTVDMTDLNADNAVPALVGKSKALGVLSTNISPSSPSKIWKGLKAKAGLTRRRWFVLKAGQLLYYNTEPNCSEVSGGGDGLLSKGATINLNYASVWRDPDNGKSFVLYLLLENGRCMRLEATSSEEADDWFDCLNETITLLQRYSFFHDDSSKTAGTCMDVDHATSYRSYRAASFNDKEENPSSKIRAIPSLQPISSPVVAEVTTDDGLTNAGSSSSARRDGTNEAADINIQSAQPHSFSTVDPRAFQLRVGPDYGRNKKKAPAGESLYDLVGMDFIYSEHRIDDFASKVELPSEWTDVQVNHPNVPPLFVVNAQIPKSFATSFFTTIDDGEGWSLVLYFRISQDTAAALMDLPSASGAVKLFARYCAEGPEAFALHGTNSANPWVGRFKLILRCERIEEFGLPSFITSYNAKPVLIRNTGTLLRGDKYVEFDLNVHRFASVPKKGMEVMWGRFHQMQVTIAGCIESRDDEEMPEALFGCVRLNFPSADAATARTNSWRQERQQKEKVSEHL